MPLVEAPKTRPDSSPLGGTITTHPAFAQIGAARLSGGDAVLYGSDFRHRNTIRLSIHRSELRRSTARDWHFDREELIEVELSEAQWATMISSLNSDSVPCTLRHLGTQVIPHLIAPPNQQQQFETDFRDRLALAQQALTELRDKIAAAGLSGKKQDELTRTLETAARNIDGNLEFVAQRFGEHMEEVTEQAKIEVEAYAQATIQRAGLAALAQGTPILLTAANSVKDTP